MRINIIEPFTGGVFQHIAGKDFQLEAIIKGETTRLVAPGNAPEACLFDSRHSGLQITKVYEPARPESELPRYGVSCSCGYSTVMRDANKDYRRHDGRLNAACKTVTGKVQQDDLGKGEVADLPGNVLVDYIAYEQAGILYIAGRQKKGHCIDEEDVLFIRAGGKLEQADVEQVTRIRDGGSLEVEFFFECEGQKERYRIICPIPSASNNQPSLYRGVTAIVPQTELQRVYCRA